MERHRSVGLTDLAQALPPLAFPFKVFFESLGFKDSKVSADGSRITSRNRSGDSPFSCSKRTIKRGLAQRTQEGPRIFDPDSRQDLLCLRNNCCKEICPVVQGSVALVMTMGALHRGHLELVRQAHELADHVVVTIFVNPTQFAPGEDYDAYPRTLDADMEALSTVGADVVWAPSNDDAYPVPATTRIDAGPVAHILEGATRPTHFAGVALVVTKALNLIRPEVALFGQKDAQQLAVIRTFVRDLDIPVRIQGVEIVRDSDGVALSSRNQYLSDTEREHARALSRAIDEARAAAALGVPVSEVLRAAQQVLDAEEGVEPDYVAIVDDDDFTLLAGSGSAADQVNTELRGASFERWAAQGTMRARILLAARVGATRLIDNADVMVSVSGDAR